MKTTQDTAEQIKADIEWCEVRMVKYPEYKEMYARWIEAHKARLEEIKKN